MLRAWGGALLGLLLLFAAGDLGLRAAVGPAELASPVPITSAAVLDGALDGLRRADGLRVALLGDSVVYGRALEEHGGDWRSGELASRLGERLDATVVNLAMEGSVPADQERLVEHVLAAGVDLVVLDVSLRSFSADFAEGGLSRDWLAMEPGAVVDGGPGVGGAVEGGLARVAHRAWLLPRYRSWLQARYLGGPPKAAVKRARDAANDWLLGAAEPSEDEALEAELMLMLKAKGRYASVALDGHPQLEAMERLVRRLAEAGTPTILFYATESPSMLPQLVDEARHRQQLGELERRLAAAGGERVVWLGFEDDLPASHFLDHVHRSDEGLAALADRVARAARDVLAR